MIQWMGRYRPLVEAIVKHANMCSKMMQTRIEIEEGIILSALEWQVLEYVIEHEEDDMMMSHISYQLGIAQSTFSKIIKKLDNLGLVDRYQKIGNKKNIIIKPSPKGIKVYSDYSATINNESFARFFSILDPLPDETIDTLVDAFAVLTDILPVRETDDTLVKITPEN